VLAASLVDDGVVDEGALAVLVGSAGAGVEATVSVAALGVDAEVSGAGLLVEDDEVDGAAAIGAEGGVTRGADSLTVRLDEIEVELFTDDLMGSGAGDLICSFGAATALLASARVVGAGATAGLPTSAGTGTLGSVASGVALAVFTAAVCGSAISLFLSEWSNTRAPPITEATMTPKAIPKWFI